MLAVESLGTIEGQVDPFSLGFLALTFASNIWQFPAASQTQRRHP
jgi:hypothetical protein